MALGVLLILFIITVVISSLGVAFLLLSKNYIIKNIMFYILSIFTIIIYITYITSLPTNFILQQIIGWVFVLINIASIVIHKKTTKKYIPYILTISSLIFGILKLFAFI
nr:hypothetical protein [uncultured Tyzzerella sp.]